MFGGGAKPTFGAGSGTTGFGGFGSPPATTGFGQSAFGKPATSAFGTQSTFGAQQTAPSLFGQTAQQAQPTGLFGGASTSGAFGSTTTATPSFGGFTQPQQNTSIFGAVAQSPPNASLFGQTGAFGTAVKPTGLTSFGQQQTTQQTPSLFGQQTASTSATAFGGFGQAPPTNTNVFGSGAASAFGQPQTASVAGAANAGSSIAKYQPTVGTDTLMKSGQASSISTKQHCITAMKEYDIKSLEELRMEDYLAGRKGPQAGATSGGFFSTGGVTSQPAVTGSGLFGATTQTAPSLFGQTAAPGTENKGIFGQSAFGQPAVTSAFGATPQQNNFMSKPFGASASTAFGVTNTDPSNPFGAKPAFGQAAPTGLFGQQPAVSAAPAFGQAATSGFGGFGATANSQQPSLFGATNSADANKPAFGLGAAVSGANTGFGGFGTTATSTAGGGGLFGTKPAAGFGATPAFGITSTPNTGFGNFTMNNPATSGTGLFNNTLNKPATTGFGGFNAQPTAPLNFNAGNTGGSLFGNTVTKPGGLFGGTGALGTATSSAGGGGLFGGGTSAFGASNTLGSGGFGTIGGNPSLAGGLGGAIQFQQTNAPIHQQILAKVTSPYGDTPIFKDLKRNEYTDATRATNPVAQQAILDMSNNQFKVDFKSSPSVLRVKPVSSSLDRKSLFDGLEQYDSSVESFNLKPSAKRLIIYPKPSSNSSTSSQSGNSNVNNSSGSNILIDNSVAARVEQAPAISNNETANDNRHAEVQSPQTTGHTGHTGTVARLESDTSRRESWLHPNNLEKVRQHNIQSGLENALALNSTLTELVPRKPLETYRSSTGGIGTRLSVSTIPENPFEEQVSTISRREAVNLNSGQTNESLANRSYGGSIAGHEDHLAIEDGATANYEPHPTGITLRRVGYYTIPSLDDLRSYLAEDGSCIVPNFTVGREGYGNVYFGKEMDVSGLNLDEIVHFRNKEIIVYPDDDNKPPFNQGLNREAQVTLDQVWPHDKTKHEPIKETQRLAEMDWEAKLRRVCDKSDTRFIEYRPETGSWVFRVKHFSKYGLSDSDEDELLPADPKKAKLTEQTGVVLRPNQAAPAPGAASAVAGQMTINSLKQAQKISEEAARAIDPRALTGAVGSGFYPMDESEEFMLIDKTQYFRNNENDFSMFDAAKALTSPTVLLAKQIACNDAHKLQLMKASLFADDEGENNKSIRSESALFRMSGGDKRKGLLNRDYVDTAAQLQWKEGNASENSSQFDFGRSSPPLPTSSSPSVMSVLREVQSETSSAAPDSDSTVNNVGQQCTPAPLNFVVRPEMAPIKSFAKIAPLHKSIAYPLCETWLADLGIYKRYTFKTSFGAQNTLMMLTTCKNRCKFVKFNKLVDAVPQLFKSRADNDYSDNLLQSIKISATKAYDNFKESILPHLEVELRSALQHEVEDSECPWFQSNYGPDLIVKHLEEALKLADDYDENEYAVSVWSLLLALWGEHEQLEGQDASCHYTIMFRRNLLSEWLENTLVERELLSKQVSRHTHLEHILDLLMCHRVIEACELAISYDDISLALVLAQVSGGPVVRQLVEAQLALWHMTKADKHIAVERLKMYMLAAGVPLMSSSHGALNVLEKINWTKVLALQLWYIKSPTCSITDALLAYEKSFTAQEFYSLPPTPSYEEAHYNGSRLNYDLRYHLLQLYSKRSHPLESLLNPATHTNDPMDYRLSWLLLQTLEALGYNQCPLLSECQLHVNFASQLENNGLWEWAIFVLLHIKQRNQREMAVQQMLYRYVSLSKDVAFSEKEEFIIHRLGVPEKWIDYAKAVKAGACRQYHLQAKYLLKAKQWLLAHEIIYQHIAPDCIINDHLSYLQQLLSKFECTEQRTSVCVPNWSNQGQIFLEFMDITEKFNQIKAITSSADIEARWENLKPQLAELCSRINLLPCPTAKHRLCQSEIAQSLACLVRGMLIVCPSLNSCVILKISLERLPLPQEYAKKELQTLLKSFVKAITAKTEIAD